MSTFLISALPALCVIGVVLIFILMKPLKKLLGFVLRAAGAIIAFTLINSFTYVTGLAIGINFFTVAAVTFLGLPGICAVAISSMIIR